MTDKPLPDDLQDRYSQIATEHARLWSPVIRPMGQRLVQALPLAEAASVRAAAPAAMIVGVNPAMGMLEVARASVDAPLVALVAMDAQRLAFRSESFDAAVLAFVLFHLADPVKGLVEVARVLRPGGTIGVATWGTKASFRASTAWDEELDASGAGQDRAAATDQDELIDTPAKLGGLLERAGYTVIRAWTERFTHQWNLDTLIAQRIGFGPYRRRLDTLDTPARTACLARITVWLAGMDAEDFVYRPEIVFGVGRRPSLRFQPGSASAGVPGSSASAPVNPRATSPDRSEGEGPRGPECVPVPERARRRRPRRGSTGWGFPEPSEWPFDS
jgi:ubiquinone/menaquinone biosynthesis C-methylase UbiE